MSDRPLETVITTPAVSRPMTTTAARHSAVTRARNDHSRRPAGQRLRRGAAFLSDGAFVEGVEFLDGADFLGGVEFVDGTTFLGGTAFLGGCSVAINGRPFGAGTGSPRRRRAGRRWRP